MIKLWGGLAEKSLFKKKNEKQKRNMGQVV
jgi:hypothetical protein